jgi:ubiquinone/menaquinone biosynthesis C-methylase UbiE
MVRSTPFDAHSGRYDDWFARHPAVYQSELLAVRAMLPWNGLGLEIGVGTGRFAAPLGVQVGLDPAAAMLARARQRHINVVQGVCEALPFPDASFGKVLMVVVLSFLDDARAGLNEIRRVLVPGGVLVVGFLDLSSPTGRGYLARHARKLFFQEATFYTNGDVERLLSQAGFHDLCWVQTLHRPAEEVTEVEALRPSRGEGAFVVVRAISNEHRGRTARSAK